MARRARRSQFLGVWIVAAVLVNLPLVHSTWTTNRIESNGVDVTAAVTGQGTSDAGDLRYLMFQLPADVDPVQETRQVEVDEATYDAAVESRELEVRVLPDDPDQFLVEGTGGNRGLVVLTLLVDLVLLVIALLVWRFGRSRGPLRLLALEDVRRGPLGGELTQVAPETYLVRGEVTEVGPDRVVLDLDGRSVEVLLNGHSNPVGHQQPAQVHARLA
jgi:hypothetical protein